jgi:hypothetical protein
MMALAACDATWLPVMRHKLEVPGGAEDVRSAGAGRICNGAATLQQPAQRPSVQRIFPLVLELLQQKCFDVAMD